MIDGLAIKTLNFRVKDYVMVQLKHTNREYVHSAVVYQKYLTRLRELIIFSPREYVHSAVVYQKYLTRLRELIIFSPWRENYQFSQPS